MEVAAFKIFSPQESQRYIIHRRIQRLSKWDLLWNYIVWHKKRKNIQENSGLLGWQRKVSGEGVSQNEVLADALASIPLMKAKINDPWTPMNLKWQSPLHSQQGHSQQGHSMCVSTCMSFQKLQDGQPCLPAVYHKDLSLYSPWNHPEFIHLNL